MMRAVVLTLAFLGVVAVAPANADTAQCYENLCWEGSDWFCFCHGVGTDKRCWLYRADCEFDRECCATPWSSETCKTNDDYCTKRTVFERERAKRDRKKGK